MTDEKNNQMIKELLLQQLEIPETILRKHREELDRKLAAVLRWGRLMNAIMKVIFAFFSLGGIAGLFLATSGATSLVAGSLAALYIGFRRSITW